MQSKATTVRQYLSELPEDRRAVIESVRAVILRNLDKDYEEGMSYGMIGYYVPHRVYPAGYHCNPKQPLPFAALASQKNYMSLYLMSAYGESDGWETFRREWAKTGKKLDMGRCCIRFRTADDLALDVIADTIRRVPAKKYIAHYESAIRTAGKGAAAAAAGKPGRRAGKPAAKAKRAAKPARRTKAAKPAARRRAR